MVGENSTDDDVTEKLQNKAKQDYRHRENMTDEDVRLGQLNNDTTYYDREGKDAEQDVTRRMHVFSGSPLDAVSICLVITTLITKYIKSD